MMMKMMKLTALVCASLFVFCGCSMMKNDDDTNAQGKANQTETNPPQKSSDYANDTMDNLVSYLKEKGVELEDMSDLDQMDFAAHEGKSFSYQGNTGYLYRLKSDDKSMKALLSSAEKNGTVKVNIDGKEQEYKASVNGDYLFVYPQNVNMGNVVTAFGTYEPYPVASPDVVDSKNNSTAPDQTQDQPNTVPDAQQMPGGSGDTINNLNDPEIETQNNKNETTQSEEMD